MNSLTLSHETLDAVAQRLQTHFALKGHMLNEGEALEAAHAIFEYQDPDSLKREVSREVFKHLQPEIARKVSLLLEKTKPLCRELLGRLTRKVGMPGKKFCYEVIPAAIFQPLQLQASISLEIGYGDTAEALLALDLKVEHSEITITPNFQCMTYIRNYVDVRMLRIGEQTVALPSITLDLEDSKSATKFNDFLEDLNLAPLQQAVNDWYYGRDEDGSDE